ncbi:MAG: calcium-translocating P-type ATPase, PMCA-type [Lachnospiraceae bacterium]|nr:calcium-translocating P-type ATPase, PMCA-type [Lachnospiraceae bacterium]
MKFYSTETNEVLKAVVSTENGLSSAESEKRLTENGKNKLQEGKKTSVVERFASQLKDPMIIILIVAAIISGVTAAYSHEGFADVIIIMIVVVINAVLGVYQESKAEKAIEALQQMAAATSKVLRDGHMVSVKSEDLVVGDVVILEAGDAVPADGRIIENASMKIEESALTGESVPVNKMIEVLGLGSNNDVPLGDRKNMTYMGSTVVYGRGKVVITDTGMNTEMGKIADAIAKAEENQTPLQIKLAGLSKVLSYLVIGICIFIFAFSLLRSGDFEGKVILETFMVAVSLAVAAIPEGLAMVVTVVLSIGVTNMSKRNAIIRKLTAVETLGCAEIICSDKTGTLTQNKMTVVEHFGDSEVLLATAMALCCDAELDSNNEATGEPTECALVNYAFKTGLPKPELKANAKRIGEAPFDSGRKMMSTVHQTKDGIIQYTKGAPDEILKLCTTYLKDGNVLPLDEAVRQEIIDANKAMASQALRVLSAAQKLHETIPTDFEPATLEHNLTFLGLTGMIDPIRPEVKDAIVECKSAGITAIMITGDHRDTAIAIAKQLGILEKEDQAITGAHLDTISEEELSETIENYRVYARVQPEHKVRIVNAWRKNGHITAMTGDGVNDAPSIKSADIGVGMGITGTDVTKNVADMVLADDNFATIVGAVEEGRRIYDNIRKAIQFLLASNMSEVLSIFFATLLGFTILKPVHLLWINLITDCFPALALGMEHADADIMERKPRSSKDGIFAGGLGFDVAYQGILVTALTLIAYFIGHYMEIGGWVFENSAHGTTMAFLTLSFAELFHSFNMRSQRGSIFKIKKQNRFLVIASVLSLILTTVVIEVPFLADAFDFAMIGIKEYAIAALLGFAVIPIVEMIKFFQRKTSK